MNKQIESLIEFARSQIGYKETPNNITKYSDEIDKNYPDFYNYRKQGAEWCDIFVDYCFLHEFGEDEALRLLCQPKKSAGAGCKYSAQYFSKKNQFKDKPEPGDQIFFFSNGEINHTGIVSKVDDKKVYTIEGNSGNAVKSHSYAFDNKRIAGYGRPLWEDDQEEEKPKEQEGSAPVVEVIKPNNSDEYYIVKKGDTLSGIAKRFNTTVNEIRAINRISNINLIYPNQKILLPQKSSGTGTKTFIGIVNTIKYPLNVRKGQGVQYSVIKQLQKGSKVELIDQVSTNGWYKLADGSGYVSRTYIRRS